LVQLAEHDEVLTPGEQRVDRGILCRQPDAASDLGGLGPHVVAGDRRVSFVGVGERGENPNRGGLAGAVGPEHRGQAAHGNLEVDAVERRRRAVPLPKSVGVDGIDPVDRRNALDGRRLAVVAGERTAHERDHHRRHRCGDKQGPDGTVI
jgi:hypothetical protein